MSWIINGIYIPDDDCISKPTSDKDNVLESIKTFRDSQASNNLFDMWCRARYNCHELDVVAFRKYNWLIHNTLKEIL